MDSDAAFAMFPRPDGSYAMNITEGLQGARMGTLVLPRGVGLAAFVARERQAVLVDDYSTDARFVKPPGLLEVVVGDEAFRSFACVPILRSDDTALALLYVAGRDRHRLADTAVDLVERIAGYATLRMRLMAGEGRERELAALRERQRLAAQLHDSVAQALFAIGVEVRRLHAENSLPNGVSDALVDIDRIAGQAGQTLRETLHAAARVPDYVTLESAVAEEASRFEDSTGGSVKVTYAGGVPGVDGPVERLMLDTVREGLCNVAKHTQAECVLVHFRSESDRVSVSIHDDGATIKRHGAGSRPLSGVGIELLRHRVTALGGTISFGACEDAGHRLTLQVARAVHR